MANKKAKEREAQRPASAAADTKTTTAAPTTTTTPGPTTTTTTTTTPGPGLKKWFCHECSEMPRPCILESPDTGEVPCLCAWKEIWMSKWAPYDEPAAADA